MSIIAFASAILATAASPSGCAGTLAEHGHIQWSEPTTVVSPDHTWELTVHPLLHSDENQSSVTLKRCGGTTEQPAMVLKRSAEFYWGGKDNLLIIDEPVADAYRVRFFDLSGNRNIKEYGEAAGVDGQIRKKLSEDFGKSASVQFYLPKVASWKGSKIVLSIGGAISSNSDGPMTPYCYSAVVNSQSGRVESLTRVAKPLTASGATCQIFP